MTEPTVWFITGAGRGSAATSWAQMEVNSFGTPSITRAVLPVRRAQRRGHVVSLSALLGIIGAPSVSACSASEFALEGWMESSLSRWLRSAPPRRSWSRGPSAPSPPEDRAWTVFPEVAVDDFAEATEQQSRSLRDFNGREPGHRDKFAAAFVAVVTGQEPPRRWVAGQDPVQGVSAEGRQLLADALASAEVSPDLAHDD